MFEQHRLQDALAKYMQVFVSTQWGDEKHKCNPSANNHNEHPR